MSENKTITIEVSDEWIESYVKAVEEACTGRDRALGQNADPIAFVCGAMVLYFHLGIQDKLPASWVFGPMAGKHPVTMKELV